MTGLTTHDDAYVIVAGQTPLSPTFYGVLVNDASESPATASLLTSTTNGTLQFSANGNFVYTPNVGFTGVDSFTYRATSGALTSDATATIYVVPLNVAGQTSTLDLVALTPQQQIAAAYLTFFGRAADLQGFDFWVNQFITSPLPVDQRFAAIADSFGESDEAIALYPLLANPQAATDAQISDFIGVVYNNLFNRAPDALGSAYWSGQVKAAIAAGQSVGMVLVDMLSGTQNTGVGQDITTLLSKVAVSLEYVLEQQEHGTSWDLAVNGAQAVALVAPVSNQPLTVLAGTANAENIVAPPSAGLSAATMSLTSDKLLGDQDGAMTFLYGNDNGPIGIADVVQPGDDTQQPFDLIQGDRLDLTQVLAGAALHPRPHQHRRLREGGRLRIQRYRLRGWHEDDAGDRRAQRQRKHLAGGQRQAYGG